MIDENIFKMSEMADIEIKDVPTLNILISYLLYKIGKPVSVEHLYDIVINTGVINYFYYQDSIDYLLTNGLISEQTNDKGVSEYVLNPNNRNS